MRKISSLLLVCLPAPGMHLHAGVNFQQSPDAYLGQKPPGDTPVVFAPDLLADPGAFPIGRIAISPDGKEIYYTQNNTWFDGRNEQVRGFVFAEGKWIGPTVLFPGLANPAYSADGNTLYLGGSMTEVKRSFRTPTGWSKPDAFLESANTVVYNFNPTAGSNFYACGNPDPEDARNGCTNVFSRLTVSAGIPTIKSLGRPLNSPGFNGDFFVSPDESYIVLSAKETKDYECEIYISYRKPDKTWTNPKSLGSAINEGIAHRFGEYVTPDNKYLFYCRGTMPKDTTILWIRFDGLLEHLRHTNFEPYVKTPIADQSVVAGDRFSTTVDSSAFFDDDGSDTLSYSAALSDGSALPDWLHFDPATRAFSGIAPQTGIFNLTVTATDPAKASATCTFALKAIKSGQASAGRTDGKSLSDHTGTAP
ncbi:MAG TPA: putative Ig domain-containing protein [Lacunisphaera sp.]